MRLMWLKSLAFVFKVMLQYFHSCKARMLSLILSIEWKSMGSNVIFQESHTGLKWVKVNDGIFNVRLSYVSVLTKIDI